jgi:predicted ATPase
MAAKGYGAPDLDHTIARAMALSQEIGDASRIALIVYGRWSFDQVTGNVRRAQDVALQYMELAEHSDDVEPRMVASRLLGTSLQATGRPREAAVCLARALSLFDDTRHTPLAYLYGADIKVMTQCSLSLAHWTLGLHRSAIAAIEAAWQRSLALGHANTTAYCCAYRLAVHAISGRMTLYEEIVSAQQDLFAKHDMPLWASGAASFAGWLRLRRGDPGAAVPLFRQSIAEMEAINLFYWRPMAWMWLGEALGALDRFDEAEEAFGHSDDLMGRTGERWAESELFRLWASVRRRSGASGAAELHARAIATADQQGAIAWKLRAAAEVAADNPVAAAGLRAMLEDHPQEEWSPEFSAAFQLVQAHASENF